MVCSRDRTHLNDVRRMQSPHSRYALPVMGIFGEGSERSAGGGCLKPAGGAWGGGRSQRYVGHTVARPDGTRFSCSYRRSCIFSSARSRSATSIAVGAAVHALCVRLILLSPCLPSYPVMILLVYRTVKSATLSHGQYLIIMVILSGWTWVLFFLVVVFVVLQCFFLRGIAHLVIFMSVMQPEV